MLGYFYDSTYILVLIGFVLCLLASAAVKGTYSKFSKVRSRGGYTGASAAERILRSAGIYDVGIERVSGNLTDHYDPRTKTLRLSDSVFNSNSVAAIGVAAHECGHAIQDQKDYAPLKIRGAIVPVANFSSTIAWPLFVIGAFVINSPLIINIAILLFTGAVAFQLITLPVEFNASTRAIRVLEGSGILYEEEVGKAKKVLRAAALTYVAAAAASILQLLRLLILSGGRSRD